ncbi:hypothetical protein UTI89UKE3_043 [Escherichia phage vB_EcoP-UTI89UKE3]|uniref:Uncharacterized protein n=1 Tax=Escherichia phage vB_EcoP-UTI89UKE2 TaxID=2865826 RepID=A0AAE7XUG0_9CAUD|nr:hypothetical protein UTI89UKE2_043 [Escherichia phage vB_EcoP-UTI89UKE2]QZI84644.1 hypothetical protein UTI89UKE3_043 [Escherichia phage vB_EcoP-UTI89UKE3]
MYSCTPPYSLLPYYIYIIGERQWLMIIVVNH